MNEQAVDDQEEEDTDNNQESNGDTGDSEEEPSGTFPGDSYDDNTYYNDDYNNYNDNGYNEFNDGYYNDEPSEWEPVEEYIEPEPEPEPQPEPEPEPEPQPEPEPIIEVPVIEDPVVEEPAEEDEPRVVNVDILPVEAFSIEGTVMDDENLGVGGVELTLTGDGFEEQTIESEEDGSFSFEDIPSGQYEIEVEAAEYEVAEAPEEIELTDRSKRGLRIALASAEEEVTEEEDEAVETEEVVLSEEAAGFTSMDWTLIITGTVFILISLFVFILKKLRNN
ncbi:carboxypeptidase-like regulatory domain-containing protein [Salinicoccus halitifaciens]|uniref:NOMO second beta-sandwich domain-containing protein n=1 Tax=Salinicoccus halitifaciens TaxID=1073415 RepID=A0ABV2E807_9STAP|nr:carboxypeptidase-like regulatory domain-containing protein [Salinicoccus halitifaciens]MCD2137694.1 carboxypeptidase-like regulatory domain-containing protein [Salinicoccus halitifaciens]